MRTIFKMLPIALLAILTIHVKNLREKKPVHELLLSNIEALASGEGDDSEKPAYLCAGTGNISCPINGENVEAVIKVYSLK